MLQIKMASDKPKMKRDVMVHWKPSEPVRFGAVSMDANAQEVMEKAVIWVTKAGKYLQPKSVQLKDGVWIVTAG